MLRKKWKSLRDNYLRHKKEKEDTTIQGNKKYQNWPWANHLQFLDNSLAQRQSVSNISELSTELSLKTEIQDLTPPSMTSFPPMVSTSIFNIEESSNQHLSMQTDFTLPAPKKIKKKSKESNDEAFGLDKVIGYLENKKKHTYDSVDHLFLSYAEMFKTFSERNQIKLKLELAKLFADMELKEIDEHDSSSSHLHTSVNNYSVNTNVEKKRRGRPKNK